MGLFAFQNSIKSSPFLLFYYYSGFASAENIASYGAGLKYITYSDRTFIESSITVSYKWKNLGEKSHDQQMYSTTPR